MHGYYEDNYNMGPLPEEMPQVEAEAEPLIQQVAQAPMRMAKHTYGAVTTPLAPMYQAGRVNFAEIFKRFIKYMIEGLAVAFAAYLIPAIPLQMEDIAMIATVAAASFAILDLYAPGVGMSARFGAGFGLGAKTVGFGI